MSQYDTSNTLEKEQFKARASFLADSGKIVELSEKKPRRTNQQNRTIHMWFAVMADFLGYTSIEDCKRDIKRAILGQIEYRNEITGKVELKDYETHLMNISELSSFMDKFKIWAISELGCYLPYYGDAGYEEMTNEYKNR